MHVLGIRLHSGETSSNKQWVFPVQIEEWVLYSTTFCRLASSIFAIGYPLTLMQPMPILTIHKVSAGLEPIQTHQLPKRQNS